ncbi:DUF2971 domain-containing protein [Aeromonas veronii bv. sobria]|uniref:DUF2971 domain-containing protein n=1 Tax=Aeromonas veronii TaxID=654 RepID=UPI0035BF9502
MILFKYLSFYDLSFFSSPTIKLSVIKHLNDPFESELTENIHDILNQTPPIIKGRVYTLNEIKGAIVDTISNLGVISLSETPRSLLMWSHYSDEHRGLCLGLDSNFLAQQEEVYKKQNSFDYIFTPQKIKYDTIKDYSFLLNNKFDDIAEYYNKAIIQGLLQKSDEWIYEKEHRLIIPLAMYDKMLISFDKINEPESKKRIHNIISDLIEDGILEEIKPSLYRNRKKSRSMLTNGELELILNYKEIALLKDIKPEHIRSVYFGHRFDEDKLYQFMCNLEKEPYPLQKSFINKFQISKDRYELIARAITSRLNT